MTEDIQASRAGLAEGEFRRSGNRSSSAPVDPLWLVQRDLSSPSIKRRFVLSDLDVHRASLSQSQQYLGPKVS